jgi:hypothetical protein
MRFERTAILGALPSLLLVLLALALLAGGAVNLLPFLLMPVVMLVPALFVGRSGPPSGGAEDDEDGGQRRGRPPRRPRGPTGGIPLPDAVPAAVRVRSHGHPRLRPAVRRRPTPPARRQPARRPGAPVR